MRRCSSLLFLIAIILTYSGNVVFAGNVNYMNEIKGFYPAVYMPVVPNTEEAIILKPIESKLQVHVEQKMRQAKIPIKGKDSEEAHSVDNVKKGWAIFYIQIVPIKVLSNEYAFVVESSVFDLGTIEREPQKKGYIKIWGLLTPITPTWDITKVLMFVIDNHLEEMLKRYLASNEN